MTDVSVCCTKHGGRGAWFGLLIAFLLCPVKLFKLSEFIHKITHTGPFLFSGPKLSTAHTLSLTAPPSPSLPPCSLPPAPSAQAGKAAAALDGVAGLEVLAQKRLEQTSTSLEAALKVVENKLAQGSCVDGYGSPASITITPSFHRKPFQLLGSDS